MFNSVIHLTNIYKSNNNYFLFDVTQELNFIGGEYF